MMIEISQILDVVKRAKQPEPNPDIITRPLTTEDSAEMNAPSQQTQIPTNSPAHYEDIAAIVDYEDARGNQTRRRIRVKSIDDRDGLQYFNAYCFERKAYRLFRLDRVSAIYDIQTGELIDGAGYFDGIAVRTLKPSIRRKSKPTGMKAFPKAYNRCYAGIKALVYIARCDGQFHRLEIAPIMEYVSRTCNAGDRNLKYDKALFSEYIQKQCPDYYSFEHSVKRIYAQGGSGFSAFYDGIKRVIDADGHLAEEEVTTYIDLKRLLKELEIESWDKRHDEPYPY